MLSINIAAWKLSLIFATPLIIYSIVPVDNVLVRDIFNILAVVLIFGWNLILGVSINNELGKAKKSDFFFIVSCLVIIIYISLTIILEIRERYFASSIILSILDFVFFACYFFMVFFLTKVFISFSEEKMDKRNQIKAEAIFLAFLVPIIGVWIIQPLLRNVIKN